MYSLTVMPSRAADFVRDFFSEADSKSFNWIDLFMVFTRSLPSVVFVFVFVFVRRFWPFVIVGPEASVKFLEQNVCDGSRLGSVNGGRSNCRLAGQNCRSEHAPRTLVGHNIHYKLNFLHYPISLFSCGVTCQKPTLA